jgi:methylmalonyl-CoA/ethylmalonyl-CoA epimerase
MARVKSIHHVAMAVTDMDASLAFWRDALGLTPSGILEVPDEQSRVAFLPIDNAEIELVQPTTRDSGIAKYLTKRGPGMHHICIEVDDLADMMARLRQNGIRLINEEPRTGDGGRKYAFVHPESTGGVLVELYEA